MLQHFHPWLWSRMQGSHFVSTSFIADVQTRADRRWWIHEDNLSVLIRSPKGSGRKCLAVCLTQRQWRKRIASCLNSRMQHNTHTPTRCIPRQETHRCVFWLSTAEKNDEEIHLQEKCGYWGATWSLLFTMNSRKINRIIGGWSRRFMIKTSCWGSFVYCLVYRSHVSLQKQHASGNVKQSRHFSLSPLCRTKWVSLVTKCFPSHGGDVWCCVTSSAEERF